MTTEPIYSKTYHGKPCIRCEGTERYHSNRGCVRCSIARVTAAHDENYWLKRHCRERGITIDDYNRMLNEQKHVCKICCNPCNKGRLCIDHDHKTNQVRGLLCRRCNLVLGNVEDNPVILQDAASYLLSFHQTPV